MKSNFKFVRKTNSNKIQYFEHKKMKITNNSEFIFGKKNPKIQKIWTSIHKNKKKKKRKTCVYSVTKAEGGGEADGWTIEKNREREKEARSMAGGRDWWVKKGQGEEDEEEEGGDAVRKGRGEVQEKNRFF